MLRPSAAVDSLHLRLEEEAHQWRLQQMGAARASGMLEVGWGAGVVGREWWSVGRASRDADAEGSCAALLYSYIPHLALRACLPCLSHSYSFSACHCVCCRLRCSAWMLWSSSACRSCRRSWAPAGGALAGRPCGHAWQQALCCEAFI